MDLELRRVYFDICYGWSRDSFHDQPIYIKHLNHFDQIELDTYYDECVEKAKKNKVRTLKERIDWLNKNKIWTPQNDIELNEQKDYVDNLTKTKETVIFKSQKEQVAKQLLEESIKLTQLIFNKEAVIGLTAEKVAEQKLQYYYIYLAFFKEDKITRLFTLKELSNLDDEECNNLLGTYIAKVDKLKIDNIKKISIAAYFCNAFYLCGEDIKSFFGKPVFELTNYQVSLISYGNYFKNIFSQGHDIPKNIEGDPDKIEEFVKSIRSLNENIQKMAQRGGNVQQVGLVVQPGDLEALNLQSDTSFLNNPQPTRIID